jgi:hypothetical protein
MIITNDTLKRIIQLTICYAISEANGDIADDGVEPLALATIQNDAKVWIRSDDCETMCDVAGIDYEKLKTNVIPKI